MKDLGIVEYFWDNGGREVAPAKRLNLLQLDGLHGYSVPESVGPNSLDSRKCRDLCRASRRE
jgi:hypothetical protein